jgi:hypothetical protein
MVFVAFAMVSPSSRKIACSSRRAYHADLQLSNMRSIEYSILQGLKPKNTAHHGLKNRGLRRAKALSCHEGNRFLITRQVKPPLSKRQDLIAVLHSTLVCTYETKSRSSLLTSSVFLGSIVG